MKVVKNINNNICFCLDSKGREVIVFGKGIGFIKPPHEIPLDKINHTFYNIKDTELGTLKDMPSNILNVAIDIIDSASSELDVVYPSSAVLSLADHIKFAIERKDRNIILELPLVQDIKQLYPKEMALAVRALNYINSELGADLMRDEVGVLALHIVNDKESNNIEKYRINTESMISESTDAIEASLGIHIDRNSFNYSRFITHFDYMLKRVKSKTQMHDGSKEMLPMFSDKYPEMTACARRISKITEKYMNQSLEDDEIVYLVIHINRLCNREVD